MQVPLQGLLGATGCRCPGCCPGAGATGSWPSVAAVGVRNFFRFRLFGADAERRESRSHDDMVCYEELFPMRMRTKAMDNFLVVAHVQVRLTKYQGNQLTSGAQALLYFGPDPA